MTFVGVSSKLISLYYASHDGQSRRIADHIFRRLANREMSTMPRDLAQEPPSYDELTKASLIVLVAAVRYGRHLPEADRFLTAYQAIPSPPPLAIASVSLSARKPGKIDRVGNPYLRKLIARHRLEPVLAVAFAGRLDYARYTWRDRQIIRFIMFLTGGPTDLAASVEYTSWRAVDAFADEIARLL